MSQNDIRLRAIVEDNTKKGVDSAKRNLGDLSKDGKKASKDLQDSNKKAAESFEGLGSTIRTGAGVAIGIVSAEIIKFGAQLATQFPRDVMKSVFAIDEARSSLIIATGASGEFLDSLTGMTQSISRQVPQSMGQVADVVGELNTRLGLTGSELEKTAKDFLDFSRITGTEGISAVRNVTRLMQDWGVENTNTTLTLDKLTVASQISGIGIEQLTNTAVNYGVQLRALGFSLDESIALLSKFEREGVSTEKMVGGLSIALGRLASAGIDDTGEAFQELIKGMQDIESVGEATREAIEMFGMRAGPDLALALQEGRFSVEEFLMAIEGAAGTLEDTAERSLTASQKIGMAWSNAVEIAAEDIVNTVSGFISAGEALVNRSQLADFANQISNIWGTQGVDSIKDHRENIHRLTSVYSDLNDSAHAYNAMLEISKETGMDVASVGDEIVKIANEQNLTFDESLAILHRQKTWGEDMLKLWEDQQKEADRIREIYGDIALEAEKQEQAERRHLEALEKTREFLSGIQGDFEDIELQQFRVNDASRRHQEELKKVEELIGKGKEGTEEHEKALERVRASEIRRGRDAQKLNEMVDEQIDLMLEQLAIADTMNENERIAVLGRIRQLSEVNTLTDDHRTKISNLEQAWIAVGQKIEDEALGRVRNLSNEKVEVNVTPRVDIASLRGQISQAFFPATVTPQVNRSAPLPAPSTRQSSSFGRAKGGSVVGGQAYMVGELGRELFVPESNGKIINNSETNNMTRNITVNIHGGDTVSVRRELERILNN